MRGLCSYYIFVGYIELLRVQFQDKCFTHTFHFFLDVGGSVVSKRSVAKGSQLVLLSLGCCTEDLAGHELNGAHSSRVSGFRFWTLRGLEVFQLQIFGRWRSCAIQRNDADIPSVTVKGQVAGRSFDRHVISENCRLSYAKSVPKENAANPGF